MISLNNPFLFATIMFAAGVGIPIGASLNGTLGDKLQNPIFATVILFAMGFCASILICLLTQSTPKLSDLSNVNDIPVQYYLGGLFVLFYILAVTWVGPRFGIGNAIAFVLLGQLTSMTLIDHFALFNAMHFPITSKRIIGLIAMAIGVFLVVKK